MKVQVVDAPHSQKEISIEIPYEELEKASDIECEKIAKDAKIPGFRPGKAPKDVVKKQNALKIKTTALEKIIGDAVRDALVGNNINPIAQPDIQNVVADEDKPITFTVYVDVFPLFSVENFKGFEFTRTRIKVTDEDVDNTLQRLKEQFTEFKPVAEKRKVKNGDQTVIDFEGKKDGVPFEGGKAEKHTLDIGSGQFIPGFEDGVIGMSLEETKDITLSFPEEYHAADLAGKEVVFTVTLHEIKEKIEPELNDEFAKKVNAQFETFEKLKERIRADLQHEADHYVKFETFTNILNKLVDENAFEVPRSIVMEQAERMAQQSLQQYVQMGINPEMFGMNAKSMAGQFVGEAEKQIKRALIISKIAEVNAFTVTSDDLNKEVERIAEMSGRPADDIRKDLLGNEQNLPALQNDLLSDKVYAYLCGENTISEKEITRAEFEKARQAEAEAARNGENKTEEETEGEKKPKKKSTKKATEKTEEPAAEAEEKPKKKAAPRKKKED